jgi:hypothetical protein
MIYINIIKFNIKIELIIIPVAKCDLLLAIR